MLVLMLVLVLVLSLRSRDLLDLGLFLDDKIGGNSTYNNRSGFFFSHI